MNYNSYKKNIDFLTLLSIFVLFFPQFQLNFGLLLEQVMTIGVTTVIFFLCISKRMTAHKTAAIIALIFLIIFSVDLLRSLDILITNDFFEYIKPFSFLLYFYFGYSELKSDISVIKFQKVFFILFIIVGLLGILEARFLPINNLFSKIYKFPGWGVYRKAVFSFISPYCLATILVLPILYSFFCFFATKKIRYFISFIILVYAMLLTQSKTVLLGFILTFIILIIIVGFKKWIIGRKQLLLISYTFVACIVITVPIIISIAKTRFTYLYDGLSVFFKALSSMNIEKIMNAQPTTRLRYEQLLFAIEHQDDFPLIGVAIGKKVLMPESFYALYLYRTGLLGMTIHFLMIFYAGKRALILAEYYANHKTNENNVYLYCFYISIVIFFISLIFSYFSSAVTDQTRVAFFFYIIIGHLYSLDMNLYRNNKKRNYFFRGISYDI